MNKFSKVLLFEQFSETADDLITILSEDRSDNQLTDTMLRNIENRLGVDSFEEFLDKFAPTIYPQFSSDDTEINFQWVFEEKYATGKGIKVDSNFKLLKMFMSIMDKRKANPCDILDFNWDQAYEEILPRSIKENAKMIRKSLLNLVNKISELSPKDPAYQNYGAKIMQIRQEIIDQYSDNPLQLLPLAIDDMSEQIKQLEYTEKQYEKDGVVGVPQIGMTTFDDNGDIKFIPMDLNEDNNEQAQKALPYEQMLVLDYKENQNKQNGEVNPFVQNLIVSVYTGKQVGGEVITLENKSEAVAKLKSHISIYSKQLDASFKQLKDLFQKLLGVKAFFDQAPKGLKPRLIVANNKLSELAKCRKDVDVFLGAINGNLCLKEDTTFGSNIWFAIMPNLKFNNNSAPKGHIEDIFNMGVASFQEQEEAEAQIANVENGKLLLQSLAENKIPTFVSFEPTEDTSFEAMKKYSTDKWDKLLADANFKPSDYTIPCFPNYTIVDPASSGYVLNDTVDKEKHFFNGMYVDASYVAAGLVVTSLEPKYLQSVGFTNLDFSYPGVRINLADKSVAGNITTTMPRESSNALIRQTLQKLVDKNVGFITVCDSTKERMFVLTCSTTNKKPLFSVILPDYLTKYIDTQKAAGKDNVSIALDINEIKNKNFDNFLLYPKDDINANGQDFVLILDKIEPIKIGTSIQTMTSDQVKSDK